MIKRCYKLRRESTKYELHKKTITVHNRICTPTIKVHNRICVCIPTTFVSYKFQQIFVIRELVKLQTVY